MTWDARPRLIDAWHMAVEVSAHPGFAGSEDDAFGFELFAQPCGQFANFGPATKEAKHSQTVA